MGTRKLGWGEVSIDLKLARLFKRLDLDQRDLCKTPTQNEAH